MGRRFCWPFGLLVSRCGDGEHARWYLFRVQPVGLECPRPQEEIILFVDEAVAKGVGGETKNVCRDLRVVSAVELVVPSSSSKEATVARGGSTYVCCGAGEGSGASLTMAC